jgi:hypothetical protein
LGWLFNNPEDRITWSDVAGFDMTKILDDPLTRSAALMYIFQRLDELLDGHPILIFLDEGWRRLDDGVFAAFMQAALRAHSVLRSAETVDGEKARDPDRAEPSTCRHRPPANSDRPPRSAKRQSAISRTATSPSTAKRA